MKIVEKNGWRVSIPVPVAVLRALTLYWNRAGPPHKPVRGGCGPWITSTTAGWLGESAHAADRLQTLR